MTPPPPPPDVFRYTIDPSLESFNVSPKQWMTQNDKHHFQGIAVASVVFDSQGRVLLVQRAAHDSMPNRWEVTGGAADQEDDTEIPNEARDQDADGSDSRPRQSRGTILSGAARELWEEAGLVAKHFSHLVPQPAEAPVRGAVEAPPPAYADHAGFVYTNRTGTKLFLRFTFHVEVQSTEDIVLDPAEHQAYVWATEEEVRAGMTKDNRDIPATVPATRAYILEAFRLRALAKGK